jgi:hypothetical protein
MLIWAYDDCFEFDGWCDCFVIVLSLMAVVIVLCLMAVVMKKIWTTEC